LTTAHNADRPRMCQEVSADRITLKASVRIDASRKPVTAQIDATANAFPLPA